jgi:L-threonate 2-dehydrogenase
MTAAATTGDPGSNAPAASLAVGQIGLGIMGGAFARHLIAAGYRVIGYDIDAARREELQRSGGTAALSVASVAGAAQVIITSLPSEDACRRVFLDADGIAMSAGRDTVVLETSTMPLGVKIELREACAQAGVTVLDCPISGTGAQAAAGDAVVYASGDEPAVQRCRPVIEAFARGLHYCGAYGNGSRLKFIANLLVTIHNLAAAEAIVLARRSGLDLDLVYRVIRDGAGTSRMFEVRAPMMIADDYAKASMKAGLYQKDIDIIGAYAGSLHCPTPLFDASRPFYAGALAQGRALDDPAVVCAVLAQMAGLTNDREPPAGTHER